MIESNKSSKVIGFYGYSDSGKTSLILRLIKALGKKRYSTVVIKCTDKSLNSEPVEKDTSRFRTAGAIMTSFSSLSETNFVVPRSMKIPQIIKAIRMFTDVDLIIVEGASDPHIPKVRMGDIKKRDNTIYTYNGDFNCLIKKIVDLISRR